MECKEVCISGRQQATKKNTSIQNVDQNIQWKTNETAGCILST